MDRFLSKYQGHKFDDWGISCSDDFKTFVKDLRSYLKRTLPGDCELIGFKPNHYDTSGFVKHGDEYIYVSYSWNRFSPVDITRRDPMQGVLVRFAKDEKDFRGETNNFTSLKELSDCIVDMFIRRCGA